MNQVFEGTVGVLSQNPSQVAFTIMKKAGQLFHSDRVIMLLYIVQDRRYILVGRTLFYRAGRNGQGAVMPQQSDEKGRYESI